MAKFVVPTAASTQEMLEMLLGERPKGGKGAALKPAASYVATYVDDQSALVAACLLDLPFAAFAGAAMSGIPPAAAKDAISSKAPTDTMLANLAEVMNILSRLLMSDTSPHLKFAQVLKPGEQPATVDALKAGTRSDISMAIARYGAGNMSFLVT